MASAYDIDPNVFIKEVANELKGKIEMPEWAKYVKTASVKERPPTQDNFWYIRAASILRSIYIKDGIGVSRLRSKYGGRTRNTHVKKTKKKASGKIIRNILQQLEKAGYVQKSKKGRVLTPQGRSLLDKVAGRIKNGSK